MADDGEAPSVAAARAVGAQVVGDGFGGYRIHLPDGRTFCADRLESGILEVRAIRSARLPGVAGVARNLAEAIIIASTRRDTRSPEQRSGGWVGV